MDNIKKVAEELFDKVRSRFENVVLGDENANETDEISQARFFNFDYKSKSGKNYGNITISLVDDDRLKVFFSKSLTDKFDDADRNEWYDFLKDLRYFSKRNMMAFDPRDINRDNLTIRDVKQISKNSSAYTSTDAPNSVTESKLYGTTRTSVQEFGPVRLLVRHSEAVNEEVPGARSRKIHAMFIETDQGERFRMPFNKLSAGRAMAEHLAHGGLVHDDFGQHIIGIVEEMNSLAFFVRSTRNRMFEDAETQGMVEAAVERYQILRNDLRRMGGRRGYEHYAENFKPMAPIGDEFDIESLKERFVKKMFDDRLTQALPYVHRAYQEKQMSNENQYAKEFDTWAKDITEGEWALPNSEMAQARLRDLMSKPIKLGADSSNATSALYDVIGSDRLFDDFMDLEEISGPDADARPVIIKWLKDYGYNDMAREFQEKMNSELSGSEPAPPSADTAAKPPVAEELSGLRRLAGLE